MEREERDGGGEGRREWVEKRLWEGDADDEDGCWDCGSGILDILEFGCELADLELLDVDLIPYYSFF